VGHRAIVAARHPVPFSEQGLWREPKDPVAVRPAGSSDLDLALLDERVDDRFDVGLLVNGLQKSEPTEVSQAAFALIKQRKDAAGER
jgi:hypothetical protein